MDWKTWLAYGTARALRYSARKLVAFCDWVGSSYSPRFRLSLADFRAWARESALIAVSLLASWPIADWVNNLFWQILALIFEALLRSLPMWMQDPNRAAGPSPWALWITMSLVVLLQRFVADRARAAREAMSKGTEEKRDAVSSS